MTRPLWVAIGLMFMGAGMVVADLGVHEPWVALTIIGMAVFVIAGIRARPTNGR